MNVDEDKQKYLKIANRLMSNKLIFVMFVLRPTMWLTANAARE